MTVGDYCHRMTFVYELIREMVDALLNTSDAPECANQQKNS